MRTTLSLDDDVAALIQKIRKKTDASLKELVNAALREGLARMVDPPAPRNKFHMTVHDAGRCYLPNLDNTAEVLAFAEGEQFK
jgi:ribbon-helix-helix CopG family protein